MNNCFLISFFLRERNAQKRTEKKFKLPRRNQRQMKRRPKPKKTTTLTTVNRPLLVVFQTPFCAAAVCLFFSRSCLALSASLARLRARSSAPLSEALASAAVLGSGPRRHISEG